jgi:hypothetical protein
MNMGPWKKALREGAIAGSVASLASTAALAAVGRRENGSAAAPINATSHWLWGRPALRKDRPSLRHTLTGYAVHHGASVFWATLHARVWGTRPQARQPGPALAGAAAAAAVACFVDYRLTPERLTPGFEHRLSRKAMFAVYACFALGLAAGSMAAAAARPVREEG